MYNVNGLEFESEEEAKRAQKEVNSIKYIKQNIDIDDPKVAIKLYDKIINEKLLRTQIGIAFLKDLQEMLRANPGVDNKLIKPIPMELLAEGDLAVKEKKKELKAERERQKQERLEAKKRQMEDKKSYRRKFKISLGFNFILLVMVVGMFVITYLSGNNTNIVNYENELINKYENWEKQLDEREAMLDAREAELNNK